MHACGFVVRVRTRVHTVLEYWRSFMVMMVAAVWWIREPDCVFMFL